MEVTKCLKPSDSGSRHTVTAAGPVPDSIIIPHNEIYAWSA
jgi:hypothetical protein